MNNPTTTADVATVGKPATELKMSISKIISDEFMQIHFAPNGSIPESALDKLYYAKINDEDIYMKLYDTLRLPFEEITNKMVFKATGQLYFAWHLQWMADHPETRPCTPMCIYYFKKHR